MTTLNGVLPVDKPVGPTSHDVVAIARRALKTRRVGHTGTLDPFASGLLLLCLGAATRLAEYLTALPKTYRATMQLGVVTDTDDRDGTILERSDRWRSLNREQVEGALLEQVGERLQVPPRYSAKKVGGERMYDVARRGGEVTLEAVQVTIGHIKVTRFEPPEVDFEVECSSGTYIRAIARDVGEGLGVGAHLTALRRTRVGPHSVDGALSLDRLSDPDTVGSALLEPAEAVGHLPSERLGEEEKSIVMRGGWVPAPEGDRSPGPLALLDEAGNLVAIGEIVEDRLQPRKVFA